MASSYNELFGLGSHSAPTGQEGWWIGADNAASTTVVDQSSNGRNGTAARNTSLFAGSGPNSWLTGSLDLNGSSDRVAISHASGLATGTALTWHVRGRPDATSSNRTLMRKGFAQASNLQGVLRVEAGQYRGIINNASAALGSAIGGSSSSAAWANSVLRYDGSNVTVRVGKSNVATASLTGNIFSATQNLVLGAAFSTVSSTYTDFFDGRICDAGCRSVVWSDGDCDQWEDGPEPVNSSAPTLSGTETESQTLTCASGTWGLPSPFASGSNGTITYTRQWTRSNDGGGSGEADISGATSNTYTLQSADVGKYIRCRVRATNDGGFDSAADTNSAFTGAIAAAGGAITAAATWLMSVSGVLTGFGALAGSVSHPWSAAGALSGSGSLAGSAAQLWNAVGSLAGVGALGSSAGQLWTVTGSMASPAGLSGSVSHAWSVAGLLSGSGSLAGSATWSWAATGEFAGPSATLLRAISVMAKRRRGSTVFTARPFEGSGTSLYANTGTTTKYRAVRVIPKRHPRGLPAIRKTSRVSVVYDPTSSFSYPIPGAWASSAVVFDIRRFKDDVENLSTDFDTIKASLDGDLEDVTLISGRATLLAPEIRAGGVVRLRFRYHASDTGPAPSLFTWARTAGPTSPASSTIEFQEGVAVYEVDTPALSDASPYTYRLTATDMTNSVTLLSGVVFTADASGPPAPTLVSAEAW